MRKRLLNKKSIERLNYRSFDNYISSNFISRKYGVHNLSKQIDKISHAKFKTFLFRFFQPTANNKYNNYYSNLKFEFRLPSFFLRTLRILPSKNRLEIQYKNNYLNFIQFLSKIDHRKNNQTIQKNHVSVINSEKPTYFFNKIEQNLIFQVAVRDNSTFKERNQSQNVMFSQELVRTNHYQSKLTDSAFQRHRTFISSHFVHMSVGGIIDSVKEHLISDISRNLIIKRKQSRNIMFSQELIRTNHYSSKLTDSAFQISRSSKLLNFHLVHMPVNGKIDSVKERINIDVPRISTIDNIKYKQQNKAPHRKQQGGKNVFQAAEFQSAFAPRSEELNPSEMKGVRKILNPMEVVSRKGILLKVSEHPGKFSIKKSIWDGLEDRFRINKKTTLVRDIFQTTLARSSSISDSQNASSSHAKNLHPILALQQKQVPVLESKSQSIITGDAMPDLIHRKPHETMIESKNGMQVTIDDQHTPTRMMRPLGIVEPSMVDHTFDIEQLTGKIMDLFEQRLKTEQERRGIFI